MKPPQTLQRMEKPEDFEQYSLQLFDRVNETEVKLSATAAQFYQELYLRKWPFLLNYVRTYTREWLTNQQCMEFVGPIRPSDRVSQQVLEKILASIRVWGIQVIADFIGALCILERDAMSDEGMDCVAMMIQHHPGGLVGYLSDREQSMQLDAHESIRVGEGFYVALPILTHKPAFFQWAAGALNTGMQVRCTRLVEMAEVQGEYEPVRQRVGLLTLDVVENTALLCGLVAHQLELWQLYEHVLPAWNLSQAGG